MRRNYLLLVTMGILLAVSNGYAQTLEEGFDHPQDNARTKVWWFHGETVGTHEGITADLQAFHDQGVGGVVYYDQVHGDGKGAFKVFSPEWWDELIFSAQEAKRLGLGFEVNASNGYVAGGKWITPDKSMQRLVTTEQVVEGGGDVRFRMPTPRAHRYWTRDVALIAIPFDEPLAGDSRSVFSADSVLKLSDPTKPVCLDMDFGREFTARSLTYVVSARGKARTSSMQVPPTHFTLNPKMPAINPHEFYGCGYRVLPSIGELEVSDDGQHYQKVCELKPKYQNLGGVKEQTIAFPAVRGRYFRIVLHDWGTDRPADSKITFGNVVLSARACVDEWQEKASLVSELIDRDDTPHYNASELMNYAQAVDLSGQIDNKGWVEWKNAPKGKWLVLRFVAVSTGGHTKHGRAEALGLECDKLSVEGARLQWTSYVKPVIDSIRAHGGQVDGICMDSHEAGPQNWTQDYEQEFLRLRGYDIREYLPVLAGYVVKSPEASAQFLQDFRRTISDLITDRYFGEFNRLCRAEGLTLTAQAIGGALCMAGDAIAVKQLVDKPQAEFWGYQTEGNYDIKDCSSAAHIYGKQIASGEAYTDITYKHSLADIKNLADYAYAFGINELVVCAVAYQPWVRKDGDPLRISTANGRQYVLNRLNTYWPMSRPFWDYQARSSWMMRQGKPVIDLCLYLGDQVPSRIVSHLLPDIPQGIDFDAFTTDALLRRMSVKDGRIVLPDGVSYRMLVLPKGGLLSHEARQQIASFRQQGVPVYDPDSGQTLAAALQQAAICPDVEAAHMQHLYFAHRRTSNEDIYFLHNHSNQASEGRFVFNVPASSAALWNAVTGERRPLQIADYQGRTAIHLAMAPREAFFIVLSDRQSGMPQKEKAVSRSWTVEGDWQVTFDRQMGGPATPVTFTALTDWTKHENPQIKYYSGTAIYQNEFKLTKKDGAASYRLRFSQLNGAAEVIINGKSAGVVWCSPWDIDITSYLEKGKNSIEIKVANSLWNRLVGDAQLPEAERITWQTHQLAKPKDGLVPSGIVGCVEIAEMK